MTDSRANTKRPSRLGTVARWLFMLALTGTAVFTIGRIYINERLDHEIRRCLEKRFAEAYPQLQVKIVAASRIEGRGIEVRGLTIADPYDSQASPMIHIDEMLIACQTDLRRLITGDVDIFRLTVRRIRARAVRNESGQWNLTALWPLPSSADGPPPAAVIEDARVEISDAARPDRPPLVLHGIHASVRPTRDAIEWKGRLSADQFAQLTVGGRINPSDQSWEVDGTLGGLDLSSRLVQALPPELNSYLQPLEHVRTRAELTFRLSQFGEGPPRFVVQGRVFEGRLDDARLPYPIDDISADLYCDNDFLRVDNLSASAGGASVKLSTLVGDWLQSPQVWLKGNITNLMADSRIRDVLPPRLQVVWDKFSPVGLVDLDVSYDQSQQNPVQAVVTCHDVAIVYERFPYPLHHVQGTVEYRDDTVRVQDLVGRAGGQPLHFDCVLHHPGPAATGWLALRSDGPVPIDDLLNALEEKPREAVRKLQPTGRVTLQHFRLDKTAVDQPAMKSMALVLQDCTLQFVGFPYPLNKVRGRVEWKDDRWDIREVEGWHGTTRVVGNGYWVPEPDQPEGIDLTLSLIGTDVALDNDLLNALSVKSPAAAEVWSSLRPRGSLDFLSVDVGYRSSQPGVQVTINAHERRAAEDRRSISVYPTWLPYTLENVTGALRLSDNQIQLRELSGEHGSTTWRMGGICDLYPSRGWNLQLNQVSADQLQVDYELLTALPPAMGRALEALDVQGLLSLNGTFSLQSLRGRLPTTGWNVQIDLADGSLRGGRELQHIHGGIRLNGQKVGDRFQCFGELDVDSVHYKGVQVTQVHGPIYFDDARLLLGSYAEAGRTDRPPRQVTGRTVDGDLTADAHLAFQDGFPFQIQLTLTRGELTQLLRQLAGRPPADVTGKINVLLKLTGSARSAHALRGEGYIRLREANLYELPVTVALLSVLSLKAPETNAFTSCDIDYRVEGDLVHLDRIDLQGDAISLRGRGWTNWQRQIQLNFYTLVGRDEYKLPFFRDVLAEASRRILEIQVVGTMSNPEVQRTAFPELDDTLQALFPEMARRREQVSR